jgi:hypothetical protein
LAQSLSFHRAGPVAAAAVDLAVVEAVARLVVLDGHEQLELASRLVEGELLGEREDEPTTFRRPMSITSWPSTKLWSRPLSGSRPWIFPPRLSVQ